MKNKGRTCIPLLPVLAAAPLGAYLYISSKTKPPRSGSCVNALTGTAGAGAEARTLRADVHGRIVVDHEDEYCLNSVAFAHEARYITVRDVYVQHAGDDAVGGDTIVGAAIDNVLVDKAFTGLAWRLYDAPRVDNVRHNVVSIRNSMIRLFHSTGCTPDIRRGGSPDTIRSSNGRRTANTPKARGPQHDLWLLIKTATLPGESELGRKWTPDGQ